MGETFPDTAPSAKPPEDRLDSWKEIASYLNRDVTTVQRWEKREGMPVHRHVHDKIGSVYAFKTDLNAWARTRGLTVVAEPDAKSAAITPSPPSPIPAPRRRRWGTWLAIAAGAVLTTLV